MKTKINKLKNLTYWSLFLFIAFSLFGGVMNKIEAYDDDNNYNQALYNNREFRDLSLDNGNIHYVGDTKNQRMVVNEAVTKSSKAGYKELHGQDTEGLCELEAFVCPNEKQGKIREISAYNSVSAQTDASPCISADGTDICQRYKKGECIVATNAYPLKTKLRIDKIGDCTVADRMNARYSNRVDVFMDKDIERAIHFGVQKLNVIEL